MKVIFLGTPDFGVPALESIIRSNHEVIAVVCQPDKTGSRGKVNYCAVKQCALQHGIPLYQFERISRDGVETLKQLRPDIMVTAAYGQILSQQVIDIPAHGIINIHGSLLPQYRGAAPIQYAVLKGDKTTGITILNTVLKVDAGEMILQESLEIGDDETSGQLFERMAQLGGKLIVRALDLIEQGKAVYTPQDESKVTFSQKITSDMEKIDWTMSAQEVHNLVRALNPSPVAWTSVEGKRVKIYATAVSNVHHTKPSGTVLSCGKKNLTVACGNGTAIDILTLQCENSRCMDIVSYLCGRKITEGTVLGK